MLTGYTIELNEIAGITDKSRDNYGSKNTEIEKTTNTDALADLFR
ncbi:Transcription termination protein NusA [hydrothermal vent metagenome]|uniref:Transcription termination protein NusA n=1 Tax=hydrothermal vent metagenome TaxID=652676 RepID=A0A1W1CVQ2_9ZZZZ